MDAQVVGDDVPSRAAANGGGLGAETRVHELESTGADAEIACREKEVAALRK
jgi:hypothetical protein